MSINDIQNLSEDVGLLKCSTGQYISTFHRCDGYQDCKDGTDDTNCYCFLNGQRIEDTVFCSRDCTRKINCTCFSSYINNESKGHHGFIDESINQSRNFERSTWFIPSCIYSTLNISYLLIHDLIFDCPLRDDEPELLNNLQKYITETVLKWTCMNVILDTADVTLKIKSAHIILLETHKH